MEKGEMGKNATGRLATYYVAECMEFNRYGEYREDIHSAEEAVKIYNNFQSSSSDDPVHDRRNLPEPCKKR